MYTSKYLPVEGEIKVGDKAKSNGAIVTLLKKEGEGDTWRTDGFPTYVCNVQKVTLFLISDDIQVGDEIYVDGVKTGTFYYQDSKFVYLTLPDGHRSSYRPESCDKVIGEIITPLIKEGQTFEHDEWIWIDTQKTLVEVFKIK